MSAAGATSKEPQRRVLLADSEELVRQVYEEELRRSGYVPLLAGSCEEAWGLFEREQPDAVVCDLGLPGQEMDGAELIRRVRASSLGRILPVVAVSAGDKRIRGLSDAVIALDVDDYLEKPVPGEKLLWRLGELINGRPIGAVHADGEVPAEPLRPVMIDRRTDFLQGTLDGAHLAALFFSFAANARSGKLLVMDGSKVKQVWFRRGFPIFAESNIEGERLGEWLAARGKVGPEVVKDIEAEWKKVDRSLGVLFVATGLLGARELFSERRANIESVVQKLFSWRRGTFYLEYCQDPTTLDVPDSVPVDRSPGCFVMAGVRENYAEEQCRALLETASGVLRISESAHFILRGLDNPSYYENLLGALSGQRTAAQILGGAPFKDDAVARASLLGLWTLGAVVEEIAPTVKRRTAKKKKQDKAAERLARIKQAVAAAAKKPSTKAPEPKQAAPPKKKRGIDSIMSALDNVSAEVSFENAMRHMTLLNYVGAARALEDAVSHSPDEPRYLTALGQAYLMNEQSGPPELQRAFQALRRATAIAPSLPDGYHWLGVALLQMGHKEEAKVTLRRSIELGSERATEARSLLNTL